MSITAALVKQLRDMTGAGMMDAKRALSETNGDIETAIDWLRTKGLAKAAKKSGRQASEGLVAIAVDTDKTNGRIVEINSETDFVARNSDFQSMVATIAHASLGAHDINTLKTQTLADGETVEQTITNKIATIGENVMLSRVGTLQGACIADYVHNVPDGAPKTMGKIAVLVALGAAAGKQTPQADMLALGRQVAMHIAAFNPLAIDADGLDGAVLDREKAILQAQALEAGKPAAVVEKMISGRLNKFIAEVTLLKQAFVVNPDISVGDAVAAGGAQVSGFLRYHVGEQSNNTAQ